YRFWFLRDQFCIKQSSRTFFDVSFWTWFCAGSFRLHHQHVVAKTGHRSNARPGDEYVHLVVYGYYADWKYPRRFRLASLWHTAYVGRGWTGCDVGWH